MVTPASSDDEKPPFRTLMDKRNILENRFNFNGPI